MILFILKGIYDNVNSIYCHLVSAKEDLAKKRAELEKVQSLLAEDEARIFAPVVEEEDDDLDF